MSTTFARPESAFVGPESVVADRVAAPSHSATPRAPAAFGGKEWWRPDATALLTFYMGLLFIIPARMVVASMGSAGKPSLLFGLGLIGLWVASRIVPYTTTRGKNPIRRVLLLYGFVFLVAYAVGYGRGLPGPEALSSDRALLATAAQIGVALTVLDGVRSRARLDVLLKRLVFFGSLVAAIGIIQFLFGFDIASLIKIPGLRLNGTLYSIGLRGGPSFRRVSSTSSHAIEFSVVMAMILPLAIHYTLHARTKKDKRRKGFQAVLLALGIAFAISRSGVLAVVVAMLVLGFAWAPTVKARAAVVGLIMFVFLQGAVPGLLGTFRSLFENAGRDPSVMGRTGDYEVVSTYVHQRPWLGRGPGTFMPDRYVLLDNQVLGTLVSTGIIGLISFFLVFLIGTSVARRVARRGATNETRHLGQALMASVTAGLLVTLTFDAFAFTQYAGLIFLLLGAIGAVWRLERVGDTGSEDDRGPVLKGWRTTGPDRHPLGRLFPALSDHLRWRRPRPV